MSHIVVAAAFVWSEYPGLRPGKIVRGEPDLYKQPNAETHVVDGPAAAETLCGLPRAQFPYEFPQGTVFGRRASPCTTCLPAGTS